MVIKSILGLSIVTLAIILSVRSANADVSVTGAVTPNPLCNVCVGDIIPSSHLEVGFLVNEVPTEGSVTVTHDSGPTHLFSSFDIIGHSAVGTLSLVGRDTIWTSTGSTTVGNVFGGIGTVELSRAATWESQSVIIGNSPGAEGTVKLYEPGVLISPPVLPEDINGFIADPDKGPVWNNTGNIIVGAGVGSIGTLEHHAGDVTTGALAVGIITGSTGTVSILHQVTSLTSNQGVLVGGGGNGTLNVINSTLTTNPEPSPVGFAHNAIDANGTIKLDGIAARWFAHGGDNPIPTVMVGGLSGVGPSDLIVSNGGVLETIADGIAPTYVQVNTGGTIKGDGTIISDVVVSGGTILPGLSPGTLTIDGDLTFLDGLLEIEISGLGLGEYDILDVTGIADFDGGTILFSFTNGFLPSTGDSLSFLNAAGGIADFNVNYDYIGALPGFEFSVSPVSGGLDFMVLNDGTPSTVPIPAAVWLFSSGLIGLIGLARRKKS